MRKSIAEQNRLFFLAVATFIAGVALIWLLFAPGPLKPTTGGEIGLEAGTDSYIVNAHMDYLPDADGHLTIEDVRSPAYADLFQPALGQTAFGLSSKTYWTRVAIDNRSGQEQWKIRLSNAVVDSFDVFVEGEGSASEQPASIGGRVPDHYWTYSVFLPADERTVLYTRAATEGSIIIPIELVGENAYRQQLRSEYLYFGLYYGFVLLMFAYMFAMHIFMRAVSYLYYSLYLISFALSQLTWNGLLQEMLGEDHWLLKRLLLAFDTYEGVFLFFFILCLWFGLLFLDKMLQLSVYAPRMGIVVKLLGLLFPLILIGLLFHWPGFANATIYYEAAIVSVLSWTTCLSVYRGNRAARYIVLALISLLGLAAPAVLYTFGLMEFNVLTHYGYQFGSVTEFLILAFAVSYQLRQSQLDKEAAREQLILNQERMVKTLEHWNEELEQTVSLRTERLVKSERERTELLQNISHDIRTPLTVVQGGIRAMMLGIEVEPGGKNKHLETIYEKVLYMNKFIDDLFLLSRFEQAAAMEETEAVRAREWLEKEFLALARDVRLTGRFCEYRLPDDDGSIVRIDRHEIRRALSNLADNACKYSPPGSSVFLEAFFGQGTVRIDVRDEGEGIAAEYLERIFERADRGGKSGDSSDGSGLGLAIAKEIVERHRGTIRAESVRGKGSLFRVTLPVVADKSDL